MPAIAAGIDHLIATVPHFAGTDPTRFDWRRRDPGFAGLLRMILGQQVSTKAAAAMWARLEGILQEIKPQSFLKLDDAALAGAGFSRQKARYARALAEAMTSGRLDLARLAEASDEDVVAALTELPGIGRWSAEVYLMFCLGRPDVWPVGDLGIILGTQYLLGLADKPKPAEIIAAAEPWKPHRSAAALLVWDYYASVAAACRQAAKAEQAPKSVRSRSQKDR
jgi:DNA-3-methyladenine glycosylase II